MKPMNEAEMINTLRRDESIFSHIIREIDYVVEFKTLTRLNAIKEMLDKELKNRKPS